MENQFYDDMELVDEKELAAILNDSPQDSNFDIDQLLNDKATKNQLSKRNVKNLIKNVLMNDDVATMLRQTLDDNLDANCLYEPKLTRAKIREMSTTYPTQSSPSQQQPIISETECRLLIEKEFPDDSEDEEYHPEKILEEEDDCDDNNESKYVEINKPLKIKRKKENCDNIKKEEIFLNDKETIGMRTRSKFSLNDTPLETIEQAFIPPDITEDMYDSACENDEWMEFLSGFKKPLETVHVDDIEDDPEYNVLCDDEFTNVDREEFRIDKSVRITRKEYNDLMDELYKFTESYIDFSVAGGESLETKAVITELNNDKNTVGPDNSIPSIPVCIPNDLEWKSNDTFLIDDKNISIDPRPTTPEYNLNFLDWKSNIITCDTTNDDNEVLPKAATPSFPINTLNFSDWEPSTACSMNDMQINEVDNYAKKLEKESNALDLNNHDTSISEQINNYCSIVTLPLTVLYIESNDEQLNNNDLNVITEKTNTVPQSIIDPPDAEEEFGISIKQLFLLKQQLTQHVQLITQLYILCTKEKLYKILRRKLKNMLEVIKNISIKKNYIPVNMYTSLEFIQEWTEVENNEIDIEWDNVPLPLYVKEFMLFYEKPVFIYPHLLPSRTFNINSKTQPMGLSEEKVLVHKIYYLYQRLTKSHRTRAKFRNKSIFEMLPMILKTVHRRWFSHRKLTDLKIMITRRQKSLDPKPLQKYLVDKEIEIPRHIIDIGNLFQSKCLFDCNLKQFPPSWKPFVKKKDVKNLI